WYFLPFYAILRAITFDVLFISSKLGGVLAMFGSIIVLFFIPWLDTSKVRSLRFRPLMQQFFVIFVIACLALGYFGGKPAEGWYIIGAQIATLYYFAFFLIIMPVVGVIETPRPLPESISKAVLDKAEKGGAIGAPVGAAAAPERKG
ncbi:MAG: cytochrome b, partial [Pseudomonadota bacterium]